MQKSSLLEDLTSEAPMSKKTCGVAKAMKGMSEEELTALESAFKKVREKNSSPSSIQTSGYTYRWLADVLKKNGYDVTVRVVEKHSRKLCACHGA